MSASLGTRRAVGLVAGREIRTRVVSKAFGFTTLALVAAIVIGSGLLAWLGSSDPERVGVVPESTELGETFQAIAEASDVDVELVPVADRDEGEERVVDGDLDVLLLPGDPQITVVVETELPQSLGAVLSALAQQDALAGEVTDLGGDPATVSAALAAAVPEVERLEGSDRDGAQIVAGFVAGILIFTAVMTTGQMVAQGVVEEKSSRVIELLLATVRPWQLMAGKVLGIGAIGLGQLLVVLAAAVGSALGFGLVETSSLDVGTTALWTLVWFVVGYATCATVLAGLAALVSRQEDVAQAISPVMMLMMLPYILAVSIAPWNPGNLLVVALSYVPICAPMLMPVRIALDSAETWEVLASLGLSVAALPLLIWMAGRLYGRGVLRTGARIKLWAALRG